jgi:hypothetical protein
MTGCGGGSGADQNGNNSEKTVSEYYPIREDVKYDYEGQGNEFASFTAYNDYVTKNAVQQQVDNGGTSTVRVTRIADGKVIRVLTKGEVYYRENMLTQSGDKGEVLLMEPLEKGTSWTLEDGSRRTITEIDTDITVPAGTYRCIEVTTEGKDSTTIDYYAKDTGLVKTVFRSGDMEVSSMLKAIEEKAARSQMARFYYPDLLDGKIYYAEKEVTFKTNDDSAALLEEIYKGVVSEVLGVTVTTQSAIRSLSLDAENQVRLDLNGTVSDTVTAEIPHEELVLQCIADTFGGYYGSGQVILTINGKPYESAGIKLKENEPISVKLDGITEKSD